MYSPSNYPSENVSIIIWWGDLFTAYSFLVREDFSHTEREIHHILLNPRTEIDVLILTEMWLDSSHLNAKYNIPGYHLECKDTIGNNRGGILMYTLNHKVRDKWYWYRYSVSRCFPSNQIVLLLLLEHCIYCVPDSAAEMDSKLETLVENVYVWSKEALLLGDFIVN